MSITEIETAIRKLPAAEVSELMGWIKDYHRQLWDKQMADKFEDGRFDSAISQALASGEPSPLAQDDIDNARRIVKERITASAPAK